MHRYKDQEQLRRKQETEYTKACTSWVNKHPDHVADPDALIDDLNANEGGEATFLKMWDLGKIGERVQRAGSCVAEHSAQPPRRPSKSDTMDRADIVKRSLRKLEKARRKLEKARRKLEEERLMAEARKQADEKFREMIMGLQSPIHSASKSMPCCQEETANPVCETLV